MVRLRIVQPLLLALVVAVFVTTFGMSLVHSLLVQQGLIDLGIVIPAALRLKTIFRDFAGLLPALGAVTLLGFAIAFFIASRLYRFAPALAYPLAGAAAIATALVLMELQFDITPIAGARTPLGLALMVATGALGGMVFGRLATKPCTALVLQKQHTISDSDGGPY